MHNATRHTHGCGRSVLYVALALALTHGAWMLAYGDHWTSEGRALCIPTAIILGLLYAWSTDRCRR